MHPKSIKSNRPEVLEIICKKKPKEFQNRHNFHTKNQFIPSKH